MISASWKQLDKTSGYFIFVIEIYKSVFTEAWDDNHVYFGEEWNQPMAKEHIKPWNSMWQCKIFSAILNDFVQSTMMI